MIFRSIRVKLVALVTTSLLGVTVNGDTIFTIEAYTNASGLSEHDMREQSTQFFPSELRFGLYSDLYRSAGASSDAPSEVRAGECRG